MCNEEYLWQLQYSQNHLATLATCMHGLLVGICFTLYYVHIATYMYIYSLYIYMYVAICTVLATCSYYYIGSYIAIGLAIGKEKFC